MPSTVVERTELKCRSRIHGVIKQFEPNGKRYIEVRCKDHWCVDKDEGQVAFHYFDLETGEYSHTKKYRDPVKAVEREARNQNGNNGKVKNQ